METILLFLLKASVGMVLFYLLYWLVLSKETFYGANRWFLIGALFVSVVVPLYPLQYTVFVEAGNAEPVLKTISDSFKNIPVVSEKNATSEEFNWTLVLLAIYCTGAIIFLLRILTQTFVLIHLMIKYKTRSLDGVRIVENEKYGLPFSFFNVVFLNPNFHTEKNLPEILAHEKVHIREHHWFDLLIIELLTVIFWFNPFIWFFERAIKQNHEYLADKGVLAQGHKLGSYQALLVNQLMGMQIIGITNNLNFALNANRLKMMTKKKTSAKRLFRFSLILPVLAILFYAFAEPSYRAKDVAPSSNEVLLETESSQKIVKLAGLVLDENGEPLPGTSVVIKGGTTGCVTDVHGKFELEVPEDASIVLSFVGKKTIKETYSGITSGTKNGDFYMRKFVMEDVVIEIHNKAFVGEVPPPPPPPKPVSEKEVKDVPPPPPPSQKGEKEVFYIVEDMPKYAGGFNALDDYISKMQKKIASSKNVKGKAKVAFTVNVKGKVTDIKIVEKDNDAAAKGAVMIVEEMPDWTPGKQRGKPVPVKYLLPVEFK